MKKDVSWIPGLTRNDCMPQTSYGLEWIPFYCTELAYEFLFYDD